LLSSFLIGWKPANGQMEKPRHKITQWKLVAKIMAEEFPNYPKPVSEPALKANTSI
jgi:hypothetical protein